MTERAARNRGLAALALVPLAAGVFGGTLAWAGSHDPLAAVTVEPAPATVAPVPDGRTVASGLVGDLTVQVVDAQARIARLQRSEE
ncbi:MAG: hypothetical protein HGA44_22260, partial [Cellulomonadaceae bacterium]|nr:hypothetical protein [Cellulomonadaceae bacterium]